MPHNGCQVLPASSRYTVSITPILADWLPPLTLANIEWKSHLKKLIRLLNYSDIVRNAQLNNYTGIVEKDYHRAT